jgi:hypothetical protein
MVMLANLRLPKPVPIKPQAGYAAIKPEETRMRRREFIAGLGSAAAWPLAARAEQAVLPVVGYFRASADTLCSRPPGRLIEVNAKLYVPRLQSTSSPKENHE